jgi:uncharacterized alpha-E superfamily protein
MLSRTAEDLFWMARNMERAENTARMLDVSFRMSLLPSSIDKQALHFEPILAIASGSGLFDDLYGDMTPENIVCYVALEPRNAGSIFSLIKFARENARAQRSAISGEAWESLNSTWLQVQNLDYKQLVRSGFRDFFDWVKERSHLFRGVVFGTMLHDDAFRFARLGTFIERADNTARILDVKYHVLLPETEKVGGYVDYYQWGALLRSVGAFHAYRKVYHDTIFPWRVAELLILRRDMPRSLHHCYEILISTLDEHAVCRTLGVPARYVSGYLAANANHEAHASSHAWAEALIDNLGWVAFDPTNKACADESYVKTAVGLDYAEAAPIRGVRSGGGEEIMAVKVDFSAQQ